MGLFVAENEAQMAMREGIEGLNPASSIRYLFVDLILNDYPQPRLLWDEFANDMSVDFTVRARGDEQRGHSLALESIARMLAERGKTLEDFGLPEPVVYEGEVAYHLGLFADRRLELEERWQRDYQVLNVGQRDIFDQIYQAVTDVQPLCAFVDGKAGRGKTFLISALCDRLRAEGKLPMVSASSAFAALLYEDGSTAHSLFKIPVDERNEDLQSLTGPRSSRADLLREACCFFWDEAPMANKAAFSCADQLLRNITGIDAPFGNKPFILLGDFRQCAPVIRGGSRREVVLASIRSSGHLWPVFGDNIFRLITPIRNAGDPELAVAVDRIGDGIDEGQGMVDLQIIQEAAEKDDLANFVFPPQIRQDAAACLRRAILCVTNKQVDDYNTRVAETVRGNREIKWAADTIKEAEGWRNGDVGRDEEGEDFGPAIPQAMMDLLQRQTPAGLPAYQLELKENTIVRLLRNMSQSRRLVKNVRLKLSRIGRQTITCHLIQTINGRDIVSADPILIPRMTFEHPIPRTAYTLERRQFPLAPAYATTFNSCQGLTLQKVGIDLTVAPFSHGQLYTAISRVKLRDDARIFHRERGATRARNVVFRELLL